VFVTFEGIDGAGKSTQAALCAEWLGGLLGDSNILLTKEPGGWPGGESLRDALLSGGLSDPWGELYVFLADRLEHVKRVIRPALEEGKTVICERYIDSTLAYQVWGRGLSLKRVNELIQWHNFPMPDLTLLFDLPLEEALRRMNVRGERNELEGEVFLSRVREGYKSIAGEHDRIKVVDAALDVWSVHEIVRDIIARCLFQ
jgi:dTMP kinase